MQQIADWLKNLGMSEYTQRFVESDIDVSVLPYLSDQDLKEIGVSLGHRRKMLAAIAELASGTGSPSLPLALSSTSCLVTCSPLSDGSAEPKFRSRGDLADRLATTLNKQLKGRGPVPDLAGR